MDKIIAVLFSEVDLWGCPYCGYRSFHSSASGNGTAHCYCGDCGKGFMVLAEGMTKSTIGVIGKTKVSGATNPEAFYPELQSHPRKGMPKHGKPDKKPEGGGEFFHSRGLGMEYTPGCFVCGGGKKLYNNIAGFVQCKESGKRIVKMFKSGAYLDYRDYEPDRVQVKIGACDEHLSYLEELDTLTKDAEGVIKKEMIPEKISFFQFLKDLF